MTWTALLSAESDLGTQARDALLVIADAIANRNYRLDPAQLRHFQRYEEAILYSYLAVALNDIAWATRATNCLNEAIDKASESFDHLGLFGGLAGLGWTVEHVSRRLGENPVFADGTELESPGLVEAESGEEDLTADIDNAILRRLAHGAAPGEYDLINGLVGFGMYFLERLPKDSAVQGVRTVFEQIEKLAQTLDNGITWYSPPELLPKWQRDEYPNGYYNLGAAHGIPGIIHFLSEANATRLVDYDRSYRLLDGAVRWLIAQQHPPESVSRFSSWVFPGLESTDGRLAWCYGDLGILPVLLQASNRTDRREWRAFAIELLDHCLAWSPDKTGVVDAPLCHGAVGVAHIFNRIYHTEGDVRCLEAAHSWYERALSFRQPGTGVGGFSALTRPNPLGPPVWEVSPGFLDGAIGIALAFLAATTPIEPTWDRMLLLSGTAPHSR
jgi:hypothetical protein